MQALHSQVEVRTTRRTWSLGTVVFAGCCVVLGWGLANTGIASGEIDPITRYGAQDEAVYTREAIEMVLHGDWMTPMLLGRPVFEKPPLLVWMMAGSMKAFGISPLAARVPAVLAGALVCTVCWWIVRERASAAAAFLALVLALTSQILFTMARHAMTDIVMAAGTILSLYFLLRDPGLRRWNNAAGFVCGTVACLLAKSVAGLLPVASLVVVCLAAGRTERPTPKRAALVICCALGVACVWPGYSLITHRDWFLADSAFQILTVGSGSHQTSSENHLLFYLRRLLYSDGVAVLVLASAAPILVSALRARKQAAIAMAAYLAVCAGAIILFQFHSEQYLSWLIPILIVTSVTYAPVVRPEAAWLLVGVCAILFILRLTHPGEAWGLRIQAGTTIAAAPLMTTYCEARRAAELYVLDVDEEFYGIALPLYRVRYGWIEPSDDALRQHPYLGELGILLHARDIAGGAIRWQNYRQRLREWGLNSDKPLETGILARDASDFDPIIRAHPESDFLVSNKIWLTLHQNTGHRLAATSRDYTLLESEQSGRLGPAPWRCEM